MTRDLRIQHLPAKLESAKAIPKGFEPRPLGPRADLLAALRRAVPDLEDLPEGGHRLQGPDGPLDIVFDDGDPCPGITLKVGDGKSVPFIVNDILAELGFRALDPASATGLFELPTDGLEGLAAWHEHRKQAAARR